MQVPDYYDVIEDPMDLTAIQKKVEDERYVRAEEFVKDIDLMIVNSYQYNEVGYSCCEFIINIQQYYQCNLTN